MALYTTPVFFYFSFNNICNHHYYNYYLSFEACFGQPIYSSTDLL